MAKDHPMPNATDLAPFKKLRENLDQSYDKWVCQVGFTAYRITNGYEQKIPVYLASKKGSARGNLGKIFAHRGKIGLLSEKLRTSQKKTQ